MSTPDTVTLPDQLRGDTWDGLRMTVQTTDGQTVTPVDLTGASIRMQLRRKPGSEILQAWTTLAADIVITDAVAGQFSVLPSIIDVRGGVYQFDIEITLADNTVMTPVAGTITITEDITR